MLQVVELVQDSPGKTTCRKKVRPRRHVACPSSCCEVEAFPWNAAFRLRRNQPRHSCVTGKSIFSSFVVQKHDAPGAGPIPLFLRATMTPRRNRLKFTDRERSALVCVACGSLNAFCALCEIHKFNQKPFNEEEVHEGSGPSVPEKRANFTPVEFTSFYAMALRACVEYQRPIVSLLWSFRDQFTKQLRESF